MLEQGRQAQLECLVRVLRFVFLRQHGLERLPAFDIHDSFFFSCV